jgi:hypothetical protein
VVGTLKRECLNHMIVFNERHARRIVGNYLEYYHKSRTHLGLDKNTPDGREVEPPERGPVMRRSMVGCRRRSKSAAGAGPKVRHPLC